MIPAADSGVELELHEEPPSLAVIAEAIELQAWLDVCTIDDLFRRVQMTQLKIAREGDAVVVIQEQVDGLADEFEFDPEGILWLRETKFENPEDVPRHRQAPQTQTPKDATYEAKVIAVIVDVICQRTGAQPTDVMAGDNTMRKALYERQEAMWCAFEMTNLRPEQITCAYFRYRSVMPLTSLRFRLEGLKPSPNAPPSWTPSEEAKLFKKWTRDTIHKTDKVLGSRFRRDKGNFHCYPTVL